MPSVIFGVRTGEVFLRNFDEGLVKTMGGVLNPDTTAGGYVVNIPKICMPDGTSNVPIVWDTPDATTTKKILPMINITGGDATPAMNRWMSIGQKEYRIWVSGTDVVTGIGDNGSIVSGYTAVESKVQDMPHDISYTISIVAKYAEDANVILRTLLRVLKPYCKIEVIDSLGDVRSYSAQIDGSISRTSTSSSATDREKGFTFGLLVEGELTLADPETFRTVTGFVNTLEVK